MGAGYGRRSNNAEHAEVEEFNSDSRSMHSDPVYKAVGDGLWISQYLLIMKPDHTPTHPYEGFITLSIELSLFRCIVVAAVDFDGEFAGEVDEIDDEAIDDVLSAPIGATGLVDTKRFPERTFCGRKVLPKLTRVRTANAVAASTCGAMKPLPAVVGHRR